MCVLVEPDIAWNVPLVTLIFLTRSLVFPILLISFISLHWSLMKAFLSLIAILWNSAFKWVYRSISPLLFASLIFTTIYKATSDSHFAFLRFCSWRWSWSLSSVQYHKLPSIVHQAQIGHQEHSLSSTNVKWTYTVKKHKRRGKNLQNKPQWRKWQ